MSQPIFGNALLPRKPPGIYRRTIRRVKAVGYIAAGLSIYGAVQPSIATAPALIHAHHASHRHHHHRTVRHTPRHHPHVVPVRHHVVHPVVPHAHTRPHKKKVFRPKSPYLPGPGKVFGGLTGGLDPRDYTSFTHLVGAHVPIWQLFENWHKDTSGWVGHLSRELSMAHDLGVRLGLSITTNGDNAHEQITPEGIAKGRGDGYILGMNQAIAESGDIVYVRPFGEMDLDANPYSAYSRLTHASRGPSHSTAYFRKAWQRMVLITRGGSVREINHQLARLGMPHVQTRASSLPHTRTAFFWAPQVSGEPNIAGNQPIDYWPGSKYVDWVGTDFFSGFPNWAGLEQFYNQWGHVGKPFGFGEVAVFHGGDDPAFFNEFFSWVRDRPNIRMVLYNQGNYSDGQLRLQQYPGAAGVVRQELHSGRYQAHASLK